jgi:hypothetical protein
VAELALRKRVRESAWLESDHLDFRAPFAEADVHRRGRLTLPEFQDAVARLGVAMSPQVRCAAEGGCRLPPPPPTSHLSSPHL